MSETNGQGISPNQEAAQQSTKKRETLGEKTARWRAQKPKLGGQLKSMGREAVKDIRSTLHEVFFGSPEHQSEPGTPLNPTQPQITDQLEGGRTQSRGR